MIAERLWHFRVVVMALCVTAVATVMRTVGLGSPSSLVFDEVFYARGAYSLVTLGYEAEWEGENQDFALGDFSGLSTEADYVVHPPTGKVLISLGLRAFGATPVGWRIASAVAGILTVLMVALIARHLLRSTVWGGVAGLMLAVDGEHVVLSRTALLDIFLTFFVVAALGLLLIDRDRTRRALMAHAAADRTTAGLGPDDQLPGMGPATGVRWWRMAAVVALGLATSVKWSGIWFAAALLVLSVVWDVVDRRGAGWRHGVAGAAVRAMPAFLMSVTVLPLVYLVSWWPWLRSEHAWGRQWAANNPGEGLTWLPEGLRSLVRYHEQMLTFHQGLVSEHNYEAAPWGWLVQWRPTAFYFEDVEGVDCGAERCVSAIHAIGHPLIWWAGAAALVYALWRIVRRRDMTAATITVALLAGWVPWMPMAHRTIFTFYTVVMAPFVVLLVAWGLSRIAQPRGPGNGVSRTGVLVVGGFLVAVLLVAAFFSPIWTGQPISFRAWQLRMWLPSWV